MSDEWTSFFYFSTGDYRSTRARANRQIYVVRLADPGQLGPASTSVDLPTALAFFPLLTPFITYYHSHFFSFPSQSQSFNPNRYEQKRF